MFVGTTNAVVILSFFGVMFGVPILCGIIMVIDHIRFGK